MKQKLFTLVSLAALLASCSSEEFQFEEQGQNASPVAEGITFKISNDAASRGEFKTDAEGKFYTAWNAEIDKIGIAYTGVKRQKKVGVNDADDNWCNLEGASVSSAVSGDKILSNVNADNGIGIAIYKTTKSGGEGNFTANGEKHTLYFADAAQDPSQQVKGCFRVYRPIYDATGATMSAVTYSNKDGKSPIMKVAVNDFITQKQSSVKANFDNFFMVADPIDDIWESDFAVGESLPLSFERPFTALAISTTGYDKNLYGELKSVKVEMEESKISASGVTVDIAKKVDGKWTYETTNTSKVVTLNINETTGLDWSDDYYAYIQALPVDRTDIRGGYENYTVTLTFEEGTFTIDKSTKNNWNANSFISISCDLTAKPYLYFEQSNTLVVNSALPKLDAEKKFDGVDAGYVTNIIANVPLTKEELNTIKEEFTGVTDMTLANEAADLGENLENVYNKAVKTLTLTKSLTAPIVNTASTLTTINCPAATVVPANAFKGNTKLTTVNLPVVEEIGANAFDGATSLNTIGTTSSKINIAKKVGDNYISSLTKVGEFAFANIALTSIEAPELSNIGSKAFGTYTLSSLTTVKLPKYDYSDAANRESLLKSTKIEEVDLSGVSELNMLGVEFNNVNTLKKVTLKEGAIVGDNVFNGCTKLATVTNLEKASVIGENAFKRTALTTATLNTQEIKAGAFENCTNLNSVNFGEKVTTIGDNAFKGARTLNSVIVVKNNIKTVGKSAFEGTAITSFKFTDATLGEAAFKDLTSITTDIVSNVTVLEKDVFKGVKQVANFTLPNVSEIKEGALANLKTSVNLYCGSALTAIDANAFTSTFGGGDGSTVEKAKTATVNYNLILSNKEGLTIKDKVLTYKATDGKYYSITFTSIK